MNKKKSEYSFEGANEYVTFPTRKYLWQRDYYVEVIIVPEWSTVEPIRYDYVAIIAESLFHVHFLEFVEGKQIGQTKMKNVIGQTYHRWKDRKKIKEIKQKCSKYKSKFSFNF